MDLVTLNMKDGSKREVELVARFRLDGFDSEYILYKLDDVCYGAKFKEVHVLPYEGHWEEYENAIVYISKSF